MIRGFGVLVKHFNRATLFAKCKHGPLTMRSSSARHSELGDLRAVCTEETQYGSDQCGTRQLRCALLVERGHRTIGLEQAYRRR